jgi:iron complex outermembrane recepter protein
MYKKTLVLAVLATMPCYANADHLQLDTIEVVADQPQMINETKVAGDTAKLLEDEPGVSLYRGGGVSSLPALHGLADDRIRIKVDGMDLISSCANHMNPALSYIAPFNVDQLSVYAGVSPVSLGGDSIAGTILVNSDKPEFSKTNDLLSHFSLNSFYRSNNNAFGVNLNASVANENVYFRYNGATVDADNYRAGGDFKPAGPAATGRAYLSADEVGSSAYRSTNHAFAVGVKHDNHLLEFKLSLQDIPFQGFVNQRMDMTDNQAQQYNFKYQSEFDWGKLIGRIYHENVRHSMNFGDDKQFYYGNAPGMPMETQGKTTGFNLTAEVPLNNEHSIKVGTDLQKYRLNDYWPASGTGMMMSPNTYLNINNGQRDRYDVFAEWDAQWNPQWKTQAGVRASQINSNAGNVQGYNNTTMGMAGYATAANTFNAQNHAVTDHNWDATLTSSFTPNNMQSYQLGYAMKTRSPNLYERYTWSNTNSMVMNMVNWFGDGNGYVGNLNLVPEVAHTVSATAGWHDAESQHWQLNVTPYFTYVNNYIDAVSCASVGKICMPRTDGFANLSLDNQSAKLYGFDVQGKTLLAQASPFGNVSMTGVMSYVRGKNTTAHTDLYNMMPLNAKLALEHHYQQWNNKLEVKLVSAKDNVNTVRLENKTAGFGLINLYTSYDWKNAKLQMSVENLLDKAYFDPLGGAYLGQGATMGTTVLNGLQVPGMGRSFNVGVTLYY